MSRIGRLPIPLPSGVELTQEGSRLRVKGPLGTLEREIHPEISIVTTAKTDEEGRRLLQLLGMPFQAS